MLLHIWHVRHCHPAKKRCVYSRNSSQSSVKVLGLHWHPVKDTLSYNVNLSKSYYNRISSWMKLYYTWNMHLKKKSIFLSFDEIKRSRIRWVQHSQDGSQKDFRILIVSKALGNQFKLVKLSLITEKDNLIKVEGQLSILRLNFHPAVSSVFVIVQRRYCDFRARNLICKITYNFLAYFWQRKIRMQQRNSKTIKKNKVTTTPQWPFKHAIEFYQHLLRQEQLNL